MKRFLLFLIAPLFFFLSINIQPASAYVSGATTCCPIGAIIGASSCFQVKGTCSTNADCGSDEYCDYWSAWCSGFGGPCKPLNCKDCQVAQNHQCVSQPAPAFAPDCCGNAWVSKQNDASNCGACGNQCAVPAPYCWGGNCIQCFTDADCAIYPDKPSCNPSTKQCEIKGVTLCSANLIISSTGTGTCTVAGSVINARTGCSGQTFEIKDSAGNSKCSGIISGTSGSCPSTWTISASTTYNLFIGGSAIPSDTKTASCSSCTQCPDGTAVGSCSSGTVGTKCVSSGGTCSLQADSSCAPATSCSAYNGNAGNCNSAGGCYYCGVYNTCLGTGDTSCPGYVDCSSYTSQSTCTMDGGSGGTPKPACGWCPNSYNGGTSANGGTCYAASVLASKCGG